MDFDRIEQDAGKVLSVGDTIVARGGDEYDGLFGKIIYIDDPDDTGNLKFDVHCAFMPPVLEWEKKKLEKTFSTLYQMEKKLDDIALDDVIMDPDDIWRIDTDTLYNVYHVHNKIENALDGTMGDSAERILPKAVGDEKVRATFYTLKRDVCIQGSTKQFIFHTTRFDDARWLMDSILREDTEEFLSEWKEDKTFNEIYVTNTEPTRRWHYAAGVDGKEQQYWVSIKANEIYVDRLFLDEISKQFQ